MSMSKFEGAKLGAAFVLAATAALGSSAQAAAPSPPPAYESLSLYQVGIAYHDGSISGLSQSGGFESASLTGFPQPALTASASGDTYGMISGAIAHLDYYYKVVGPDSETPVNLQITGFLTVRSSSIDGSAKAFIDAGGVGKTLELYSAGELQSSPTWLISVLPGAVNFITMQVNAGGNDYEGAYDAYAFADPVVSFVGAHDGYSLVFSPGIGNGAAPGVPEPATWAMMVIGFGALGAALRRRSRPALAA